MATKQLLQEMGQDATLLDSEIATASRRGAALLAKIQGRRGEAGRLITDKHEVDTFLVDTGAKKLEQSESEKIELCRLNFVGRGDNKNEYKYLGYSYQLIFEEPSSLVNHEEFFLDTSKIYRMTGLLKERLIRAGKRFSDEVWNQKLSEKKDNEHLWVNYQLCLQFGNWDEAKDWLAELKFENAIDVGTFKVQNSVITLFMKEIPLDPFDNPYESNIFVIERRSEVLKGLMELLPKLQEMAITPEIKEDAIRTITEETISVVSIPVITRPLFKVVLKEHLHRINFNGVHQSREFLETVIRKK